MLFDYLSVVVLLVLGLANIFGMMVLPKLLRPHNPTAQKLVAYECGENPIGTSWLQYNVRFFVVALVFIIFDMEIVFMFPWAVVFKEVYATSGPLPLIEMAFFIAVLAVGLIYLWVEGLLDWIRTIR